MFIKPFPYLIFVIFLHGQNFWKIKFTLKFTQKIANLHSKLPIFRVKSEKIYTGQKEFTRAPPVTNMRYGFMMLLLVECDTIPCPANMCVYDTWLFMVSEIISRPLCFATDIARMETPVT